MKSEGIKAPLKYDREEYEHGTHGICGRRDHCGGNHPHGGGRGARESGGTELHNRLERLIARYKREFPEKLAFLAASAERERQRLNFRMDVLMARNAPDEWLSRIWWEIHALDVAAGMLLGRERREVL